MQSAFVVGGLDDADASVVDDVSCRRLGILKSNGCEQSAVCSAGDGLLLCAQASKPSVHFYRVNRVCFHIFP